MEIYLVSYFVTDVVTALTAQAVQTHWLSEQPLHRSQVKQAVVQMKQANQLHQGKCITCFAHSADGHQEMLGWRTSLPVCSQKKFSSSYVEYAFRFIFCDPGCKQVFNLALSFT